MKYSCFKNSITLLGVLTIGLAYTSCNKEESSCLTGVWRKTSPSTSCEFAEKYSFNSDGTGTGYIHNCPNACNDGAGWGLRTKINWWAEGDSVFINPTERQTCNQGWNNLTIYYVRSAKFSCDDDLMTFSEDGSIWSRE